MSSPTVCVQHTDQGLYWGRGRRGGSTCHVGRGGSCVRGMYMPPPMKIVEAKAYIHKTLKMKVFSITTKIIIPSSARGGGERLT